MPRGRFATVKLHPVEPTPDVVAADLCRSELLTVTEAATRLRRARSTLYVMMNAGELAYVQSACGCHRFIPVAAIVEYLAKRLRRN